MNRIVSSVKLLAVLVFAANAFAGGGPEDEAAKRYGPFEALTIDHRIVRDVKYVVAEDSVYLQLLPDHKEKELIVKLSNEYFASYREWDHGGYELVSPAGQGKQPYGWTDHVNTSANYIEYWMDGEVFLHLKRVH